MKLKDIIDKIYVGVVEDNIDPFRMGRIKVRVQGIYNNIPLEHIPYASPLKSLDGKTFTVPSIGKIVSVVFDNGNIYMPVYRYSENYNINLQKKLDSLNDKDYVDFQSFVYDHKTQNFVDKNGYRLDYYYNQIHIDEENINLRLKDNTATLNLGSRDSDQDAVLGTNFFDWFDKFIDKLSIPTSLIGNMSAPILRPEIDALIIEYRILRNNFLSKHVKLPDNNKIEKVKRDIETEAVTNDSEMKINNQDPFQKGVTNTENSNIINEDIKQKIIEKNEIEQENLNNAQPSNLLNTEEYDYHEDTYDAPEKPDIQMINENGEEYPSDYETLMEEQKTKSDDSINSIYENTSNQNSEYDAVYIIEDENYGTYLTSSVVGNKEENDYVGDVTVPSSIPKKTNNGGVEKDDNGNIIYDTVPIYINGKKIGDEPYVLEQGKKVVKKYYKPLKSMIEAAKKDGVVLKLNEGYREYDIQYRLRKKNAKKPNYTEAIIVSGATDLYSPLTGKPGYSMHHRGTAFDFSTNNGKSKSYNWLVKNAIKFGFVRTVASETWHWEYQPWVYRKVPKNDVYAVVGKSDPSWMGISIA
jgi:hypothetical protein